ncbi:hypothetical protein BSKO_13938 [Bryopsis sp. KO-2023]|nr:hypothetical protein BSKO_13938 [Bryopsis sp. KO-2023]
MAEFVQYQPQCSDIDFSNFNPTDALKYDPEDSQYLEDIMEEGAIQGFAIAGVCLVVALVLILMSLCLCCIRHHWRPQPAIHRIVEGPGWKRVLSLFLISCIVLFTVAIAIMSAWGIQQTVANVDDAVDDSFKFIEQTKIEVDSILGKARTAIEVGNEIVVAIEEVNKDLDRDTVLNNPSVSNVVDLEGTKQALKEATIEGKKALDTADEEISQNLNEVQEALVDALTFEDDGESASQAVTILVICCFSVFIFISMVLGCCSVFGRNAKLTACWVIFMWMMLVVAFALGVGILNTVRELSEDSCLFINDFGVRKVKQEVTSIDNDRIERLLRFYFQAPGESNLTVAEVENLWDLPLTTVNGFLDDIDEQLFDENGQAKPIVRLTSLETQASLVNARGLFPAVRSSINDVQELITGDTIQIIHKDMKDLLCCTQYDAVDVVFWAWVTSSIAGFILACLVTWQVMTSVKFSEADASRKYHPGPPAQQIQLPSRYAETPVAIGKPIQSPPQPSAYMQQSSATVTYPTVHFPEV